VLGESETRIELKELLPPPRAGAENDCIGDAFRLANWLSDMDSNHDKSLQRALCYHYTIGQTELKLTSRRAGRKEKVTPEKRKRPFGADESGKVCFRHGGRHKAVLAQGR
jgi:hypothetical protein